MSKNAPLAAPSDVAEALTLLTRIPVPITVPRGSAAAWAWPLAGLVTAILAATVAAIALAFGQPPTLAAGLAITAQIVLTGALHEDGLADSADGLWGGHDISRRLEIMKDSRIGSYGVLALGLSLLLRWSALSALFSAGWVFAPLMATGLLSRAPMALLAASLPNARGDGLSHSVGQVSGDTAALGVALAIALALLFTGTSAFAAIFWISLATIALAALAKSKIGGQTGDVLGASQQVAEIAALCALTATL